MCFSLQNCEQKKKGKMPVVANRSLLATTTHSLLTHSPSGPICLCLSLCTHSFARVNRLWAHPNSSTAETMRFVDHFFMHLIEWKSSLTEQNNHIHLDNFSPFKRAFPTCHSSLFLWSCGATPMQPIDSPCPFLVCNTTIVFSALPLSLSRSAFAYPPLSTISSMTFMFTRLQFIQNYDPLLCAFSFFSFFCPEKTFI